MSRFEVRRDAQLRKLAGLRPFVAASLVEVKRRCGNPRCRCARGQPHRAHVLTRKVEGRTETVHVAKDRLEEVRRWVEEYKRLKRLVRAETDACLALLRHHGRVGRAAAAARRRSPR
jgi:hypothetical protein